MCVCMCVQIMVGAYQFIKVSTGLVKQLSGDFYTILIYKDILLHTNSFLRLHLELHVYRIRAVFPSPYVVSIFSQIFTFDFSVENDICDWPKHSSVPP